MPDLLKLHNLLATAASVEAVFGPLAGGGEEMIGGMKRAFRAMAMVAHPDRSPAEAELAEKTFRLLEMWRLRAEVRIREGTYGKADAGAGATVVTTRRGKYTVHGPLARGDYGTLYRCTRIDRSTLSDLVFRVVREPGDNDLLEREVEALRELARGEPHGRKYFPEVVDAFVSTDGSVKRQAVILGVAGHSVRLTDLHAAFPAGLDPRDAAWIFNRLLEALWFTHQSGLVNGAILPANLLVDLDRHSLMLAEWGYSTTAGTTMRAISADYADWYPAEVLRKAPATPATDIFMAARFLTYLLGGNPISGELPHSVPMILQRFIRACLLPAAARRPSDAGELREEFDACLKQLYGKRAFRPLAMPV